MISNDLVVEKIINRTVSTKAGNPGNTVKAKNSVLNHHTTSKLNFFKLALFISN